MPNAYVQLPWYRESAFRAWVRNSLSTLALAVGTAQSGAVTWGGAFAGAGVLILKDLLASAYDIWWAGPDVFQVEPPPPGPAV